MSGEGGFPRTIEGLLFGSGQPASSPAILGVDGGEITYGRLREAVAAVGGSLRRAGFGRGDRIALVLPNGPLLATAILAVSASYPCAPLNPGFREGEFRQHLSRLGVKALVVKGGAATPAREVARAMGIRVLEAVDGGDGAFALAGLEGGEPSFSGEADDAFLLHTSGTTAVPKLVPLTQSNICHTAHYIGKALGLGQADRCLNVMTLFHGLGLVSLLTTLLFGGSIVCAPGFVPGSFFGWLEGLKPTWYTAVPPVHRTVIEMAKGLPGGVPRNSLRFIRSAAAPLPPRLMLELEAVFKVPVLEAYGMTEAFMIGSSPPPPRKRKPGSVGLGEGPEVRVMDGEGRLIEDGRPGEIVVRGPNVMRGYEGDPKENEGVFTDGWMRTGDLGHIDGEGYIFIDGRVKELINRGGEKVTPNEVDDALGEHPAVSEAAAFGVSHETMGEEVVAAVVLRPGVEASEDALRGFVSQRLALYKVPSRIFFVKEIPKGPSGKILRRKLREELGLQTPGGAAAAGRAGAPRGADEVERRLISIWEREMGIEGIGPRDNFFRMGGYSLLAVRIFDRMEKEFGVRLHLATLYVKPTLAEIAAELRSARRRRASALVPLRADGTRPRLFLVHAADGEVYNYGQLVEALGEDQPVFGLEMAGIRDRVELPQTIEKMAGEYVRQVKALQPRGPYHIAGWCAGGLIAFEMAQQLSRAGDQVGLLGVLDFEAVEAGRWSSRRQARKKLLKDGVYLAVDAKRRAKSSSVGNIQLVPRLLGLAKLSMRAAGGFGAAETTLPGESVLLPDTWRRAIINLVRAMENYRPERYPGVLTVFKKAPMPTINSPDPADGWGGLAAGLVVVPVGGRLHGDMVKKPNVCQTAKKIRERMDWHEQRAKRAHFPSLDSTPKG